MAQPTKEQAILICCGATMVRQEVVPKTWAPSAVKGPQMDPIILEGPVRVRWWLLFIAYAWKAQGLPSWTVAAHESLRICV